MTATHGVLSGLTVDRLKNSRVSEFVFTDTLPDPVALDLDKLTVLSIAPMLARAIREIFQEGSVTGLFESA